MTKPQSPEAYIASFAPEVQQLLQAVRACIIAAAPQATEVISYSMPAFKQEGILVWYAAHSQHIGLYPRASAIEVFKNELSPYKTSKGAIQFPFAEPLPLALITRIVQFRLEENLLKMKKKRA